MRRPLAFLLCFVVSAAAISQTVIDDTGNQFTLSKPVQRLISLAPHITELIYSMGAGKELVGASQLSDFPAEAKSLPRVGQYDAINIEAVLALKPDLVVAWKSGNRPSDIAKLRELGVPVYLSEIHRLGDLPGSLRRLGVALGEWSTAYRVADAAQTRIANLRHFYVGYKPIKVFYQVWPRPLMTVSKSQFISDAISLCGGVNVFANLPGLTPTISEEALLNAAPDVLVTASAGGEPDGAFDHLKRFSSIPAVRKKQYIYLVGSWISRPTLRLIDATEELCIKLNDYR